MQKLQLLYGNATQSLRFKIPTAWKSIPTAVNIQVEDNAGTELLAATAATIGFAADTSSAATIIGATTMTLTTGVTLVPGDRVYIAAGADGEDERATVEYYDSSGKVITFARALKNAHASGVAIKALWFTYTYDISTTATYTVGRELTINWIPNNHEPVISQRAKVVKFEFELQDLEEEFQALYPQEHQMIEARYAFFEASAQEQIQIDLPPGFDLDRHRNPESFKKPILEYICYMTNKSSSGNKRQVEALSALKEYNRIMASLTEKGQWFDVDQDDVKDEQEERPMYAPPGRRGYA